MNVLCLLFFILCIERFQLSRTEEAPRLEISSLTIKVTGLEEKDGLTFTGNYPSTILAEQEVTLDTEILVTFRITSSKEPNESVATQQRYIMFQSKSRDLAKYVIAEKQKDKLTRRIKVDTLAQSLGKMDAFEVAIIVGDPKYKDGVLWNLGTLSIKSDSIPKDIEPSLLPLRLKKIERKPEIEHIFHKSQERPSSIISILFTILSGAPLGLFFMAIKRLNLNFLGVPSGASRIWLILFHGGVLSILGLYTVFYFRLNLVQIMFPLFCLALFCFITGYHALCAVAGTSAKEKIA